MQEAKDMWVQSLGQEIPWRRKWQPAPGFLPGKFHGQRHLASYSPWSQKVSGTTESAYAHNTQPVYISVI